MNFHVTILLTEIPSESNETGEMWMAGIRAGQSRAENRTTTLSIM